MVPINVTTAYKSLKKEILFSIILSIIKFSNQELWAGVRELKLQFNLDFVLLPAGLSDL